MRSRSLHNRSQDSQLKSVLEVLAVVGPIICLIDCIVIPVAVALLPLVGVQHIFHGISDQIITFIVLCICAPALLPGFLKHRKTSVLLLMGLGFGLIFCANFAGHAIDETLHTLITVTGSALLIKANLDNKRFSRGHACCKHELVSLPVQHTGDGHASAPTPGATITWLRCRQ